MKRGFRLTRSTDFKRVRRFGKSYAHPLVVLVAQPSQDPFTRVAVVAGASVGGAVVRNLAKRRLRACLDEVYPNCLPGWDLILIARKPIAQADFLHIRAAVFGVFRTAGLLQVNKQDSCD